MHLEIYNGKEDIIYKNCGDLEWVRSEVRSHNPIRKKKKKKEQVVEAVVGDSHYRVNDYLLFALSNCRPAISARNSHSWWAFNFTFTILKSSAKIYCLLPTFYLCLGLWCRVRLQQVSQMEENAVLSWLIYTLFLWESWKSWLSW